MLSSVGDRCWSSYVRDAAVKHVARADVHLFSHPMTMMTTSAMANNTHRITSSDGCVAVTVGHFAPCVSAAVR